MSHAALAKTNTQHKNPQKSLASLAKTPQVLASLAVSHKKRTGCASSHKKYSFRPACGGRPQKTLWEVTPLWCTQAVLILARILHTRMVNGKFCKDTT
jgi:hypothetical protein